VTALHGDDALRGVTLTSPGDGIVEVDCIGLFCFVGAEPETNWLTGVALGEGEFIRTDRDLLDEELRGVWDLLGRSPLPYETAVPGVFAVGDVRSGSMKRVAAAVGEGASAIRSVHLAGTPVR
jgi:thioredoxin reductase (NADPH)